jgi:hypothetical protein
MSKYKIYGKNKYIQLVGTRYDGEGQQVHCGCGGRQMATARRAAAPHGVRVGRHPAAPNRQESRSFVYIRSVVVVVLPKSFSFSLAAIQTRARTQVHCINQPPVFLLGLRSV